MSGDTQFTHFFTDALQRPDRGPLWLEAKRKSMSEKAFRQEYAMNWQDALYGGGEFTFDGSDLDVCGRRGPRLTVITAEKLMYRARIAAAPGHKYVKSWDIGRHADAAVCTVVDADTFDVVAYSRLRETPFPRMQSEAETIHGLYPGTTWIEKNGPGEAVAENCDIVESQLELFHTSKPSKQRIISNLELLVEKHRLGYSANDVPQLDVEMRGYQVPDDAVIQDSVMSLAIACDDLVGAPKKGKVGKVVTW
jgi:hypothetical protein